MRRHLCSFSLLIAAGLVAGCAHQSERMLAPKPECTGVIDFDKPDHGKGTLKCGDDNPAIFEVLPDEPFPAPSHCTASVTGLAIETIYGDYDCGKAGKGNLVFILQREGEGRGVMIPYNAPPLSVRSTWQ